MTVTVLETGYDVDFDLHLDCWCLHYNGEIFCLDALSYDSAMLEAEVIVSAVWEN